MRQKQDDQRAVEKTVREIKRRTRRRFSPEEKIRIVLQGLRGEDSIAELCRREGLHQNQYYTLEQGVSGGGAASGWRATQNARRPVARFRPCGSRPCS